MIQRHIFITWLLLGAIPCAFAQETPPPNDPPVNETLEPAVDTSAPEQTNAFSEPASAVDATADKSAVAPEKPAPRAGRALDRLELDATQITGNRELPKVLYIVPWKRSDLGDLLGKPVNSLLDEVLEPVDRDVFKRENRYYRALSPDTAAAAPSSAPEAPAAHPE
jgi:hypothetical protein